MNFKAFMEPSVIVNAALQARRQEGVTCARFGDCIAISKATAAILKAIGVNARLVGGKFYTGEEDGEFEHSWLMVGNFILDSTIDQFFSSLDVDMETKTPGVYFSHSKWDGNEYAQRYRL